MGVVAIPNREFAPDPEAVAAAGVALESLDELDAEVIMQAARLAR
jgi:hypothetical protein